jgi:hypothetical protein
MRAAPMIGSLWLIMCLGLVAVFLAFAQVMPTEPTGQQQTTTSMRSPRNPTSMQALPTWTPTVWTLAMLVNEADAVVRVKYRREMGGVGHLFFSFTVLEWYKQPPAFRASATTESEQRVGLMTTSPAVFQDSGIPFPYPPLDGEVILFLKPAEPAAQTFDEVVGDQSGGFSIVQGRIEYAGIPRYKGWTLERFEKVLRTLLGAPPIVPKELGSHPPGTAPTIRLDLLDAPHVRTVIIDL